MSAPEVTVFEWPDRFHVECRNPDDEYRKFFKGLKDFDPLAPYLVDLSEMESGWCGCRFFAVNIEPGLGSKEPHETECPHITAAREYRQKIEDGMKMIPNRLNFGKKIDNP